MELVVAVLLVILALYRLWRFGTAKELARFAAWALHAQPLLSRDSLAKASWGEGTDSFLLECVNSDHNSKFAADTKLAAAVASWYRRSPFNDAQVASLIESNFEEPIRREMRSTRRELLEHLGPAGAEALARLEKKWTKGTPLKRRGVSRPKKRTRKKQS